MAAERGDGKVAKRTGSRSVFRCNLERWTVIGIAIAAALAAGAQALSATSGAAEPAPNFRWVKVPDERERSNNYPAEAGGTYYAGQVDLECRFDGEGKLSQCKVLKEDPAGYGFGQAALRSTVNYRAEAVGGGSLEGKPVRLGMIFAHEKSDSVPLIQFRHPQAPRAKVTVDCRYRRTQLDNCIIREARPRTEEVTKLALMLVSKVQLQKLPRGQGRVVIPIEFIP